MAGKSTFARALRMERERLGLTQKELAEKLGCAQQNIAGMENDKSLPKPDLHDKMVEIFGQTSPIAALPPRRDIVELMARVSSPMFSRQQETLPESSEPLRDEWREVDFSELLPASLRGYIEAPLGYNGLSYTADYLSPALLVEVKHVGNPANMLNLGRHGLHHLSTMCRIVDTLRLESEQQPKPILILVSPNLNIDKSMMRLSAEAELHGIEVLFAPNNTSVAELIRQREHSTVAA